MSKFKVRVSANNKVRLFEVDRNNTSVNALTRDVGRKFQLSGNLQLICNLPTGTKVALSSDADLKRALTEAMNGQRLYVEAEISGHQGGSSAPVQQQPAHQPVHQQQPAHQPAQQQQPVHQPVHQQQPAQQPAQSSTGGTTTHFVVPGRAGGVEKLKFAHSQEEVCSFF